MESNLNQTRTVCVDLLAGYFKTQGYQLTAVDSYQLESQDLGRAIAKWQASPDRASVFSTSRLSFFS